MPLILCYKKGNILYLTLYNCVGRNFLARLKLPPTVHKFGKTGIKSNLEQEVKRFCNFFFVGEGVMYLNKKSPYLIFNLYFLEIPAKIISSHKNLWPANIYADA